VACQRGKDKKATSFGAIDEQCFQADAPKQEAKARSSITRKCAGLSGPQVGSCSPLPDCVITQSLVTARAAAEDAYGAPPDARGSLCGNGIPDVGEFCDDGNRNDQDACTNECVPAVCGDGIVETGVEECDDGNNVETDACTHLCQLARCGDGIVEAGVEECDDGAAMPNADCADCHRPPVTCTAAGLLATGSLVAQGGTPSDLAGVTIELSYSAPLGIPGSGADPSVRARVTDVSGAGGFPTVNDTDSNGDGVDDDLKYGYAVAGAGIPIGPLVQVQFDCPAGTMVLPASLPCIVTDASDSSGQSLSHCTVDGSSCRVDADCQPPKAMADEGVCDTSPRPRCTITLAPAP
jgi:cysteine-rich repeat protein